VVGFQTVFLMWINIILHEYCLINVHASSVLNLVENANIRKLVWTTSQQSKSHVNDINSEKIMPDYKKILVAIDVYAKENIVLRKAIQIANTQADISLIYVTVPQVHFDTYGASFGPDFVNDMRKQAELNLKDIAKEHGISESHVSAKMGSPADEIHNMAKEIQADLIVIGTHGQSGLRLLLGSTANAVLHGVKCDVLAVKV
jgi:universal stress protein A